MQDSKAAAEPTELSVTLASLREKMIERVMGVKPGSLRAGMRPIVVAIEEMDRAGVRVCTTKSPTSPSTYPVGMLANLKEMRTTQALRLRLYDVEANQDKVITLREDVRAHEGEYAGKKAVTHVEGILRARVIVDSEEDKHFENAQEAVEWLVSEIAPCVVVAPGVVGRVWGYEVADNSPEEFR